LQQSVVPLLLLAPRSRMNVVFRKQAWCTPLFSLLLFRLELSLRSAWVLS
jgi:hypothetical protein